VCVCVLHARASCRPLFLVAKDGDLRVPDVPAAGGPLVVNYAATSVT
jgi:hypothetical protein